MSKSKERIITREECDTPDEVCAWLNALLQELEGAKLRITTLEALAAKARDTKKKGGAV